MGKRGKRDRVKKKRGNTTIKEGDNRDKTRVIRKEEERYKTNKRKEERERRKDER